MVSSHQETGHAYECFCSKIRFLPHRLTPVFYHFFAKHDSFIMH